MATFRLQRQTSRSSRFAQVTVEVEPASRPEVEVAATVPGAYRLEAELGSRWALRRLPPARVTVTEVIGSEVDTTVGDVHEAAAHAVWRALRVEHQAPYVGFSDPRMVMSWLTEMCGRRLDAVTEARHTGGLLHAWLSFDHAVPCSLHGSGDQLFLAKEDPYRSYDMGEFGETRVGPAREAGTLGRFAGSRLIDGAVITGYDGAAACAGLVLRFDRGDLVVGSLADEWVLAEGAVPANIAQDWVVAPFVRGRPR